MKKKIPHGRRAEAAGPANSDDGCESASICAFSESDFRQLGRVTKLGSFAPEIVDRLQQAAQCYLFAAMVDRSPNRSESRKTLKRIASRARALVESVETLDVVTAKALDDRNEHIGHVIVLAESAEQLAERILRGGEPKLARRRLVKDLADIYYDARGEPPTRRHNPNSGEDYGPFFDFVRAALEPIDSGAVKGVEHDIRAVLAIWQKPTPR